MSARARPSLSALLGRELGWALGALGLALAFAVHVSVLVLLERAERDKAQALARQLAELSVDPLLVRDYGVLERAADALAARFDVAAIEIERGDGVAIARAGALQPALPEIALPIVVQSQRLGQVRLRYDLAPARRAAWSLTAALTLGLALLLAAAFVLARHLIDRRVLAPVRALLARVGPGGSAPTSRTTRPWIDCAPCSGSPAWGNWRRSWRTR